MRHLMAQEAKAIGNWTVTAPPPTTLIVAWPDDEPPTRVEAMALFNQAAGGIEDMGALEEGGPDVRWNALVGAPGLGREFIAWVEPGRAIPEEIRAHEGLIEPRWVIGMETMLDFDEPLV